MASIGTLNLNFETNVGSLINDMRKASRSVNNASTRMSKGLGVASTAFKGLAAGFAAGFTFRAFARASDEVSQLRSRIEGATRSAKEFEVAFKGLSRVAIQTGGSLRDSVDVFQRLSFSRDEIGATVEEMVRFTETVQKFGVVSGASTTALSAGLTQLGQGLSAGILRAEEFNSIVENIPGVANAIAEEFGVTAGELRKLVLEGEVLSQDVFNAILNQSQRANEEFEQMPLTISRATAQLSTQFKLMIGGLDEATGASQFLANGISALAGSVAKITDKIETLAPAFRITFLRVEELVSRILIKIQNQVNTILNLLNKLPFVEAGDEFSRVPIDNAEKIQKEFDKIKLGDAIERLEAKDVFADLPQVTKELSKDYQVLAKTITDSNTKSKKSTAKVTEEQKRLKKELQESERRMERFGDTIGNTFFDFITGATDAKSALSSLLKDLSKFLFNSSGAGGFFGDIVKGIFGGGGGISIGGFAPDASISDALFRSLGFAKGGVTNKPAIFGEAGPEAAVPLPDGRRIPVQLMGGGSGGNVYNIDARGADAGVEQRVMRALESLRQDTPNIAINSVSEANKRNPGLL